ncbi:MAG: signal peptidase I [Bacteroidota bacterium]
MKIKLLFISVISLVVSCTSNTRQMDSSSMEPTISRGEKITIEKTETLKRQDIIAFNYNDPSTGKKQWAFRIIGIPGDTIQIKHGALYVNGKLSKEPYSKLSDNLADSGTFQNDIFGSTKENSWNTDNYGPIVIPLMGEVIKPDLIVNEKLYAGFLDKDRKIKQDLYFVLGDNRHDAYDSRFIGFIPKSEIAGVVKKE